MKTELDSAWESAIHNAERARKAEAEIERLQAELAEAKKFKDGMLDVLGGACPNDHRSTPFEEFKGCTPCLRDELAECRRDAERLNWLEQNQSGVYPVTERVRVPTTTMTPRYIDEWRFVGWSVSSRFDELPNIRNAIDAALAADRENNDGNA